MPNMALPLKDFKQELLRRRVSLYESSARRVARQVFKQIRLRVDNGASPAIVTHGPGLEMLVKMYGCKIELVPYAVQCVKDLVASKTLQ